MGMGRYAPIRGSVCALLCCCGGENKCLADRNKRSTSAKPTDAAGGLLISFASGRNLCEGPSGASSLPPPSGPQQLVPPLSAGCAVLPFLWYCLGVGSVLSFFGRPAC